MPKNQDHRLSCRFDFKPLRLKIRWQKMLYLPLAAMLLSCSENTSDHPNKFSDPTLVKIADFQDRRLADSLMAFLDHENPRYRAEAVLAFGSVQSAPNIDRIGKLLLMDADEDVRRSAAFALGQIQNPACERILLGALVKEKSSINIKEILNSYGKATTRWQLDASSFLNDSIKSAGLAWSLYRAGMRGKADASANEVAMQLLSKDRPWETRFAAAHYFARGAKAFNHAESVLAGTALGDPSADVRMAAVLALGKVTTDSSLAVLKQVIKDEEDARVVVNALKALRAFPYDHIKHYLYEALGNKDVNVGIAASEVIIETVPKDDWIEVSSLTNRVDNWRIRANLYEAALKAGQNQDLAAEVKGHYQKSNQPYERAAYLGSLKHYPAAHEFVATELHAADTAIIRSSAASTLVSMAQYEGLSASQRRSFAQLFQNLMQSQEDPAVLGTIASALADSTRGYLELIRDTAFLYTAKKKLRMPEHVETLHSIDAAIAYLTGDRMPSATVPAFNHPIDWELVRKIPNNQRVTIKTSRGDIVMRLFVDEAPGSVANFISLAQRNYYDGKVIHRVVPNFVIQDGCKRGDGWGSEDYSIRSEFSLRNYKTGSVGMASAGKDTEGTQWFIAHSPTPHLDGRYTIFAEVIEGLPVINYLQVGDKVRDVVVDNFTAQ